MQTTSSLRLALAAIPLAWAAAPSLAGGGQERISELLARGRQPVRVTRVHPSIWMASGNSNAYLVKTSDGAVVIDTGLGIQGAETHAALREASGGVPVRRLILTHAHEDHVGGAPAWIQDGAQVIAQRFFPLRQQYYQMLADYRDRRGAVLWGGVMPGGRGARPEVRQIRPDVLVDDAYSFEQGGTRFEVISLPGGEGPDAVGVWIPAFGALFCGDALGPAGGSFPNLFTLRGENLREPIPMLASLDRAMALQPSLLLPGHFEPVQGRDAIGDLLSRTSRGLRFVHDATVKGMNEGRDLWTLMREIQLPAELHLSEQYGRVAWGVRAIYELYTGWFRYESTTELYDVPPRAVYPELAQLAGGAEALAKRARAHVESGEPLQALHLCEVALAGEPGNRPALEAQRAALELLARRDGGANFQVAGWLRHALAGVESQLKP